MRATPQQTAQWDFSDIQHLVSMLSPWTVIVMIGEAFPGTIFEPLTCWGSPPPPVSAGADTVSGFNSSSLSSGYNVVFRPWVKLQTSDAFGCFPYNDGAAQDYQNVNYNLGGPYSPSKWYLPKEET
jgi:hypothetical protein